MAVAATIPGVLVSSIDLSGLTKRLIFGYFGDVLTIGSPLSAIQALALTVVTSLRPARLQEPEAWHTVRLVGPLSLGTSAVALGLGLLWRALAATSVNLYQPASFLDISMMLLALYLLTLSYLLSAAILVASMNWGEG
jgi:hypothetical protein